MNTQILHKMSYDLRAVIEGHIRSPFYFKMYFFVEFFVCLGFNAILIKRYYFKVTSMVWRGFVTFKTSNPSDLSFLWRGLICLLLDPLT